MLIELEKKFPNLKSKEREPEGYVHTANDLNIFYYESKSIQKVFEFLTYKLDAYNKGKDEMTLEDDEYTINYLCKEETFDVGISVNLYQIDENNCALGFVKLSGECFKYQEKLKEFKETINLIFADEL